MLAVIVYNKVTKSFQKEFLEVSLRHSELSKNIDKGCLRFDVTAPKDSSDEIVYIELWDTAENLELHSIRGAKSEEMPIIKALRYENKMEIYNIIKQN